MVEAGASCLWYSSFLCGSHSPSSSSPSQRPEENNTWLQKSLTHGQEPWGAQAYTLQVTGVVEVIKRSSGTLPLGPLPLIGLCWDRSQSRSEVGISGKGKIYAIQSWHLALLPPPRMWGATSTLFPYLSLLFSTTFWSSYHREAFKEPTLPYRFWNSIQGPSQRAADSHDTGGHSVDTAQLLRGELGPAHQHTDCTLRLWGPLEASGKRRTWTFIIRGS